MSGDTPWVLREARGHLVLAWALARRDLESRYRGSLLGLAWAILTPLLMLAVYTFVFGVVFQSRWQGSAEASTVEFGLALFCGLATFNLFADAALRAPMLVVAQPNLVKKVVFPIGVLPVSAVIVSLVHALVAMGVLLLAVLLVRGEIPATVGWLPLTWLPVVLMAMATAFILSALGVYVRDIGQGVGVVVTAMLFLSPIFYPLEALPEPYRTWSFINPMAAAIENTRGVVLEGRSPSLGPLGLSILMSSMLAFLGYRWFRFARKGFADVL